MGLIWDLIQQGQLNDAHRRAGSIEERVQSLEMELERTNRTLIDLMRLLETKFGEDLNRDGRVG